MKIRDKRWELLLVFCVVSYNAADASSAVFNISVGEAMHRVNERFLSLTVDPKELLDGINIR